MVPTFVAERTLPRQALEGGRGEGRRGARARQRRAVSAAAATAPELEGIGGLHLEDRAEAGAAAGLDSRGGRQPFAKDSEAPARLREVSKEVVGAAATSIN